MMILWHKVDQENTMIAMGSNIPLESYKARAAVDRTAKGRWERIHFFSMNRIEDPPVHMLTRSGNRKLA